LFKKTHKSINHLALSLAAALRVAYDISKSHLGIASAILQGENLVQILAAHMIFGREVCWLAERFGSGDGERKTLLTRQTAFEPLPASVLFAFVSTCDRHRLFHYHAFL
jgi:hypothetical protein